MSSVDINDLKASGDVSWASWARVAISLWDNDEIFQLLIEMTASSSTVFSSSRSAL